MLPALAANYRNILKQVGGGGQGGSTLCQIGEDPTREGLLDTPMRSSCSTFNLLNTLVLLRAAKAINFFTKGYQETVQMVVKVTCLLNASHPAGPPRMLCSMSRPTKWWW